MDIKGHEVGRVRQAMAAICTSLGIVALLAAIAMTLITPTSHQVANLETTSMIVQGSDLVTVSAIVRGVGGEITHELGVINAVGANLTSVQMNQLAVNPRISLAKNRSVRSDSGVVVAAVRDEF